MELVMPFTRALSQNRLKSTLQEVLKKTHKMMLQYKDIPFGVFYFT